tara:strand:+ start:461 stop:1063 length:603 start_codon:yes stop_codon:yes gene_type:complete
MKYQKAVSHIKNNDIILGKVINSIGKCTLSYTSRDPFDVLVSSIISQQLSANAAKTIKNRLLGISGNDIKFDPKKILQKTETEIKKAGLSKNKTKYIKELAKSVGSGKLNFRKLTAGGDQMVIDTLVNQPGIGPWTAEMFLIFSLGRLDVLSLGDAGLKRAVKNIYGFKKNVTNKELVELGNCWKPYRSIASWYLWRSLD